jgi:uncharacterized membrane protein YkvA (DUF1232 family)
LEQGFWDKLKDFAVQAGKEVVEKALILYYAAQRPETPLWAKTVIYSALAYFILPTDAIPDLTPLLGYTDDLGTLVAAVGAVAVSITPEVRQAAKQKMQDWFGEDKPTENHRTQSQSHDPIRVIPIE